MTSPAPTFQQLTEAEDYFQFFDLPYDPQFLSVHRLHILQKFSGLIKEQGIAASNLDNEVNFNTYRTLLQTAYDLFQTSSPLEQKLFKVFKDKPQNVVLLSEITLE